MVLHQLVAAQDQAALAALVVVIAHYNLVVLAH